MATIANYHFNLLEWRNNTGAMIKCCPTFKGQKNLSGEFLYIYEKKETPVW